MSQIINIQSPSKNVIIIKHTQKKNVFKINVPSNGYFSKGLLEIAVAPTRPRVGQRHLVGIKIMFSRSASKKHLERIFLEILK